MGAEKQCRGTDIREVACREVVAGDKRCLVNDLWEDAEQFPLDPF